MRSPDGSSVRALRVGRQVENVAVATGAKNDRITEVGGYLAGHHVASYDPARVAIHHDQVEHLGPGIDGHATPGDFLLHLLIRAEQELLARLTPGVERAGYLGAT